MNSYIGNDSVLRGNNGLSFVLVQPPLDRYELEWKFVEFYISRVYLDRTNDRRIDNGVHPTRAGTDVNCRFSELFLSSLPRSRSVGLG